MKSQEHIDINKEVARIKQALPAVAKKLSERFLDMSVVSNARLAENPDSVAHHSPQWHQFGILTHSDKFKQRLETDVVEHLKMWGVWNKVSAVLDQQISGLTKMELLKVVALVHDIGKFTARTSEFVDGEEVVHYYGHAEDSAKLIRNGLVNELLQESGFTDTHINYIAKASELHFELGDVRRAAANSEGFNVTFVASDPPLLSEFMSRLIKENPDMRVEVGVLFLADSFSKSDYFAKDGDDAHIEAQREGLAQQLEANNLSSSLINQALQVPVNVVLAKKYFEMCFAEVT